MNDYDFRVSKPGKDVDSDDLRDYIFYGEKESLIYKRNSEGTGLIELTNNTADIVHGFDFAPVFLIYEKLGSNDYWQVNTLTGSSYANTINEKRLHLVNDNYPTISKVTFRYFIFGSPLLGGKPRNNLPIEKESFGFLTSIKGKEVTSDRVEDFNLNSTHGNLLYMGSILIQVDHPGGTNSAVEVSVPNPLGYSCVHLASIDITGNGSLIPNNFTFSPGMGALESYEVKMKPDSITASVTRAPDFVFSTAQTSYFKIHLYNQDLDRID